MTHLKPGTPSAKHDGLNVTARMLAVARGGRLLVAVFVAALAALLAALSVADYESLKAHVDVFSVDRDAGLSRDQFDQFVVRLRVLAVLVASLATLLVVAGPKLDRITSRVLAEWWTACRAAPRSLWDWARVQDRLHLSALVAIVAVGVGLRVAYLNAPMRYDEAATYNAFVSKPLYVALANYSVPNNHLFHTFLAKLSVETFGNHPWSLRLPALLAGMALMPASYALARVLFAGTAALLTTALVATSSTLIEYSTNARGYSLLALLTVLALLSGARVLEDGSRGAWAALAVCSALGLYAVPTMVYALGGVYLWIAGSRLLRHEPARDVAASLALCLAFVVVLAGVLYVPVFAASGFEALASNSFVAPTSVAHFFTGLPSVVRATLDSWYRDLPRAFAVVLAVGVVASVILSRRVSRYPLPPLVAMVAWAVPVVFVQRVLPFTRVWLYLVPIVVMTAAGFYGWAIERTRAGPILRTAPAIVITVAAATLVVSANSVRTSTETGALPNGPAIAAYLEDILQPGDSVLAIGSDAILAYYLARDGRDPSVIWRGPGRRIFVVVNQVKGDQTLESDLDALPAGTHPTRPRLLRRWPSAEVYVVGRA